MAVNVRLHLFANRPCVRKWVEYIPLCPVYNPTYLLQKEGMHSFTLSCKALSTLLQKSETVAEKCDCRRIQRQSHFSATVWTGLKDAQDRNDRKLRIRAGDNRLTQVNLENGR